MTTPESPLALSVLDQSPVPEGAEGGQALRNSIDLARFVDRLGYRRYWVAEHHATPLIACASPEVLIGPIAAATERMRVGSGGVMLPHYSPLKVAENFSMLSALFPGRIDLGIGRAPGTDQRTAYALQRDRRQMTPDDFPGQLAELLAFLHDRMPADHPFARLSRTLPGAPAAPEVWMLGSSPQSGIWAAELGLSYMFADFIQPGGAAIAARYAAEFTACPELARPRAAVAVSAICAETDEEAWRLSSSGRMVYYLLQTGRLGAVPSVEAALRFLADEVGDPRAVPAGRRFIVGSPATVKAQIEDVAREYGADEVMIVTIVHDHQARRRSYALIAEAFGMAAG